MPTQRLRWLAMLCAISLSACGYWPPGVDSARAIRKLDAGQWSICAGALTPEEIGELGRLQELQYIKFGPSWDGREGVVSDEGLIALGELKLPDLRIIQLVDNDTITSRGIVGLCELDGLRGLALDGCDQIGDEAVFELALRSRLEGLGLGGCTRVTDEGLRYLASMDSLTDLTLSRNPNITFGGVQRLGRLPRLHKLYLERCSQFSAADVRRLRAFMPTVRIAHDDGIWSHDDWVRYQVLLAEAWN